MWTAVKGKQQPTPTHWQRQTQEGNERLLSRNSTARKAPAMCPNLHWCIGKKSFLQSQRHRFPFVDGGFVGPDKDSSLLLQYPGFLSRCGSKRLGYRVWGAFLLLKVTDETFSYEIWNYECWRPWHYIHWPDGTNTECIYETSSS